ncbi:class I SAM-dependent methyltransferase [Nonomuraea sp. KC401]|uniref:class I SAM-dependent DNA methyltransferase n=1 Tax=unclassified Nonomuraea TaxID=2593643 RepID=UPI0010FD374E|nr:MULTISPECIES: class I SAM-dependent methyltransferase [unclassified Nonomuraea]NBE94854.1 methyltransferase domain-containing protein [Nonomuraea sp. K271]TLF75067.1 class I SAM-dependent methyltransferase [Nonomuraea sp. KC401]
MTEPDLITATREAYDAVAARYAEDIPERYHAEPLNHAMIPVFVELIRTHGGGLVADVGCGPGHVTAHLHALGLSVFGVDLSPEMIVLARSRHPELRFEVGAMEALKVDDAALAGVLANYSIIHTPPERLPEAFAEFHRVLAPGGHLLLGFQAHDDATEVAESFDHLVSLAYRYSPDHIAGLLLSAGLTEVARLVISPEEDPRRGFPQAYLLARRAVN